MLKQRFAFMSKFFTRERFGRPQLFAAGLLAIFLGQCLWLSAGAAHIPNADPGENRILGGLQLWHGGTRYTAYERKRAPTAADELNVSQRDAYHSALYYLVAAAPFVIWPEPVNATSGLWGWLARAPFVGFGVFLGASLWYVARRLYGNAGGYIALVLYCFAPGMVRSSTIWFAEPETGAAWGAFGAIFTAIAVSHTLYAPREVVLWNWRRILLLGLSLALAIGSQWSLVVLLPIVLVLLVYLAPDRRWAALAIWAAATGVALLLLFAAYGFQPAGVIKVAHQARFFGLVWQSFAMPRAYAQLVSQLGQLCPALWMAFPAALAVYVAWPRTRYFGNTAPVVMAVLFLVLGLAMPHYPCLGFRLISVPFLLLFIAGISADLLETEYRAVALACIWGLLGAYALWNLLELVRATST